MKHSEVSWFQLFRSTWIIRDSSRLKHAVRRFGVFEQINNPSNLSRTKYCRKMKHRVGHCHANLSFPFKPPTREQAWTKKWSVWVQAAPPTWGLSRLLMESNHGTRTRAIKRYVLWPLVKAKLHPGSETAQSSISLVDRVTKKSKIKNKTLTKSLPQVNTLTRTMVSQMSHLHPPKKPGHLANF